MANVCERCKRSMSSHDNHASCPQCRMAAGECSLDSENPSTTCKVWTHRQWGKLRRSLVDARARSCQRGRQHWSAAFPRLEAWIQSKPASTSASEISSQAGEGDFEEDTLVSTPEQQAVQVLVVQAQNGANMASGTAATAPNTSTTAPSTRPGQSKDGQKALTVSVSTDSKKRKTESQDDAPQGPRKAKRNFQGDKNKGNKQ